MHPLQQQKLSYHSFTCITAAFSSPIVMGAAIMTQLTHLRQHFSGKALILLPKDYEFRFRLGFRPRPRWVS
jgi:hypothetical protein